MPKLVLNESGTDKQRRLERIIIGLARLATAGVPIDRAAALQQAQSRGFTLTEVNAAVTDLINRGILRQDP